MDEIQPSEDSASILGSRRPVDDPAKIVRDRTNSPSGPLHREPESKRRLGAGGLVDSQVALPIGRTPRVPVLGRADIALVSKRVPPTTFPIVSRGRRVHLHSTSDLFALDDVLKRRNVSMILDTALDTAMETTAGGFDPILALEAYVRWNFVWQAGQPSKVTQASGVLLSTDGSPSSVHLAEEAARRMCDVHHIRGEILGVICSDGACMGRAINAAILGNRWSDAHVRADFLSERPVLYTELRAHNVVPDIMIATAARPLPWNKMGAVLNRSPGALRNALQRFVRPALLRLEWISEGEELSLPYLAGLVHQRREYLRRYAARYRRDLIPLFAVA